MRTEIQVPSRLEFLIIVENWLLSSLEVALGSKVDWPMQSNRVRLVLAEAYSNVVRHAHRDRPHVPVLVRLKVDERTMSLEIWDHGSGFDLEAYLPPVPEARQESGYGWMILNRLMDQVEYSLQAEGTQNCLRMETCFPAKVLEDAVVS
ncbi:MAG: ATP-binding protein [Cyanobacteria bacterium P01_F01_bin.153]